MMNLIGCTRKLKPYEFIPIELKIPMDVEDAKNIGHF